MPHRDRNIPEWIFSLQDDCLQTTAIEALEARWSALKAGVKPGTGTCGRSFASAEKTLDAIEFGRVSGKAACRKAADALRKFVEAKECARK